MSMSLVFVLTHSTRARFRSFHGVLLRMLSRHISRALHQFMEREQIYGIDLKNEGCCCMYVCLRSCACSCDLLFVVTQHLAFSIYLSSSQNTTHSTTSCGRDSCQRPNPSSGPSLQSSKRLLPPLSRHPQCLAIRRP